MSITIATLKSNSLTVQSVVEWGVMWIGDECELRWGGGEGMNGGEVGMVNSTAAEGRPSK